MITNDVEIMSDDYEPTDKELNDTESWVEMSIRLGLDSEAT